MVLITQYLNWILVGGGLVGLFLGGEALIRGAVAIADRLKLPKLLVGLTIVGFGTSMPELLVSLKAVQSGAADVAIGNVVGSNIANILLILGAGALIRPISTASPGVRRDAVVMVLATGAFAYLAWRRGIAASEGIVMTGALAVYILVVLVMDRKAVTMPADTQTPLAAPWSLALVGVGLAALIFGADALVRGATAIATEFGVPEAVIGLTLVAVGTSLPELTVSVISAVRGQNELALGNVVGSNIFNILAVLGITSAVAPFAIKPAFLRVDVPVMVAAAVALGLLVFTRPRLGRLPAIGGLLAYGIYMTWLASGAG